jgi:NAD(P)-dependent dehydrogenase (short-subunit alcohol dehydrogenase family)
LEASVAIRRIGTLEEVVDIVAFLIGSESAYINGSVVEINNRLR